MHSIKISSNIEVWNVPFKECSALLKNQIKMKNLLFFTFLTVALCSCQDQKTDEINPIDNITVVDRNGEVLDTYQYDVVNKRFIGNAPLNRATTISGTRESAEPNNSQGLNYKCIKSTDVCYEK